jgi:hypothetical protein
MWPLLKQYFVGYAWHWRSCGNFNRFQENESIDARYVQGGPLGDCGPARLDRFSNQRIQTAPRYSPEDINYCRQQRERCANAESQKRQRDHLQVLERKYQYDGRKQNYDRQVEPAHDNALLSLIGPH